MGYLAVGVDIEDLGEEIEDIAFLEFHEELSVVLNDLFVGAAGLFAEADRGLDPCKNEQDDAVELSVILNSTTF
jgi:hypothetical protein